MQATWKKHSLIFKQPAGTSRGVLHTKDSYFIVLQDGDKTGIGECGLLRGLSADDRPDYQAQLNWLVQNVDLPEAELYAELLEFPSLKFGLEMALRDMQSQDHILFPSAFTEGRQQQPINGLIWMGEVDFMKKQVREKLAAGFSVLKMKIGAVDLDAEMSILKNIREEFSASELELRVDANGAFSPSQAREVLEQLAKLNVHSIEQPIAAGHWEEMAALCDDPAIPIALDEELIGLFSLAEREEMLRTLKPQYIILKPSLVGGWRSSEEWISLAEDFGMGWWVTSALESNIGLNAIAQWNFVQKNTMLSGLGTGSLYTNNFDSPLYVQRGQIGYNPSAGWGTDDLLATH